MMMLSVILMRAQCIVLGSMIKDHVVSEMRARGRYG